MRLTRLYSPGADLSLKQAVPLNADQAHYITRVLRQETGSKIILFNEISGAWEAVLTVTGKHANATPETQIQKPMPPQDIDLLIAPLKKEAWFYVLEKATELGVASIQPVVTEYTQNARLNMERDRANLIEASQQCERTHIPDYAEARKLDRVLATWDETRILYVALERHDAPSLKDAVDTAEKMAILIGPEGGFSPAEKGLLLSKPFVRPVSLGPLVLRAETAAVAALAVMARQGQ